MNDGAIVRLDGCSFIQDGGGGNGQCSMAIDNDNIQLWCESGEVVRHCTKNYNNG